MGIIRKATTALVVLYFSICSLFPLDELKILLFVVKRKSSCVSCISSYFLNELIAFVPCHFFKHVCMANTKRDTKVPLSRTSYPGT